MKRVAIAIFACCLLVPWSVPVLAPTYAQNPPPPDIVVPSTVSIRNGHMVKVTATTALTSIKWLNLNQDLDLIDSGLGWVMLNAHVGDSGVCAGGRVKGNVASYQIAVYGAKLSTDGKSAIATDPQYITVNVTLPTPPVPPVPPVPPTPPTPDALTAAVQAAYATETDPAKSSQAALLAQLYAFGAQAAEAVTVVTWQDLVTAQQARATALGVGGKLPSVQGAVGTAFFAACPTMGTLSAQTLSNPIDRTCAAAFLTKAAAAVGTLK